MITTYLQRVIHGSCRFFKSNHREERHIRSSVSLRRYRFEGVVRYNGLTNALNSVLLSNHQISSIAAPGLRTRREILSRPQGVIYNTLSRLYIYTHTHTQHLDCCGARITIYYYQIDSRY